MIGKMLEGTETEGAIKQALETLPMTERRRRYEEDQAEQSRLQAEALRQKSLRLEAQQEDLKLERAARRALKVS